MTLKASEGASARPAPAVEGPGSAAALSPLHALLLALLCALVWGKLVSADFSNDDELLIVNNLYVRDFAHFWDNVTRDYFYNSQGSSIGYWRPLTKVSYMVGWALWGANPAGYYAVNVGLFTAAILLAALVVRRSGAPVAVALGAAALTAVHPAHSESVGIVTSRSDVLAALFLLAVLAVELHPRRRPWHRAAGLVLAAAGLLSKEVAVIAPVLAGVAWLQRPNVSRQTGTAWRAALGAALPYLALVAAYALLRLFGLSIEPRAGVHQDVGALPMALATGKAAGIYSARLAAPFLVEPIARPALFPTAADLPTLAWCSLALAALALGAVLARRRSRWLALAVIALPLAPALSLRYVTISVHADRLPVFDRGLILPSFGVAWLLATGVYALARRLERRGVDGRWVALPAAAWGLVLAAGAFDNVLDSQTAETRAAAYVEGLEHVPEEELPLFQRHIVLEERAIELAQAGDLAGAEGVFKELIELDPTNAAARANLAMLYRMTGRPELAVEELRWILGYQGTTRTARDRRGILLELAQALAESGDGEGARKARAEADRLAPEGAGSRDAAGGSGDGSGDDARR